MFSVVTSVHVVLSLKLPSARIRTNLMSAEVGRGTMLKSHHIQVFVNKLKGGDQTAAVHDEIL